MGGLYYFAGFPHIIEPRDLPNRSSGIDCILMTGLLGSKGMEEVFESQTSPHYQPFTSLRDLDRPITIPMREARRPVKSNRPTFFFDQTSSLSTPLQPNKRQPTECSPFSFPSLFPRNKHRAALASSRLSIPAVPSPRAPKSCRLSQSPTIVTPVERESSACFVFVFFRVCVSLACVRAEGKGPETGKGKWDQGKVAVERGWFFTCTRPGAGMPTGFCLQTSVGRDGIPGLCSSCR